MIKNLWKIKKKSKGEIYYETWIKTNLSKITLALALTGAVSGVTGLIIGLIAQNKTNGYNSFLNWDYTVTFWGGATIWEHPRDDSHKIDLYFGIKPKN
ncbi:hypothetical protein [Spiroplasma ixodetis]|uniref:hypothetical protein n=1 Tax=Spiroplasma ixodetis TaxID=2141 RepID=UPI0025792443|nr:hypothetical protein [Spiroplasma ixodetis]WJG70781.1 hypothetical protein SIXOD_v1c20150 [Spiroplasma ixodetis Y32]